LLLQKGLKRRRLERSPKGTVCFVELKQEANEFVLLEGKNGQDEQLHRFGYRIERKAQNLVVTVFVTTKKGGENNKKEGIILEI